VIFVGLVDTSTIVEIKEGVIKGLTKRTLKVDSLVNPTGKFHIGMKRAYELWPSDLVSRIKEERKKEMEKDFRNTQALLYRQMTELEANNVRVSFSFFFFFDFMWMI